MYISASAPEAPPLSDTTSGCFMRLFFWIAACIMRAIWSEAPPAPAATTISTGFVGSQAAAAGEAARKRPDTAAATRPIPARLSCMGSPPMVLMHSSESCARLSNCLYEATCMMRPWLAAILALSLLPAPAAAILIRADRDDAEYLELATRYTSSVLLD